MNAPAAGLKTTVYEHLARIGKALAHPRRLELIDLLSQGPRTVDVLAQHTVQSLANTSHHLQILRRARLVDAEKAGLYVTYRLADSPVSRFFLDLRRLGEDRLAEIEQVRRLYRDARVRWSPWTRRLLRRVRLTGEHSMYVPPKNIS
jgi:DNA-binding transcriptional ArsR family regulator